jgi:hypothetical protein
MNSPVWSSDALWQKARQFKQKASSSATEAEQVLSCALALELLARAALATIHPALLAEATSGGAESFLFAFGGPLPKKGPKSIGLVEVLRRLRVLRPEFLEEHATVCATFANFRNEELHSGISSLEKMLSGNWLADFYRAADPLLKIAGHRATELYGKAEASTAKKLVRETDKKVISRIKKIVGAKRGLFKAKTEDEQLKLQQLAAARAAKATASGGHRVQCPACKSTASLFGAVRETTDPQLEEGEVVVRQTILPNKLRCYACGLVISSTGALQVEQLAKPFTRVLRYSPLDYYRDVEDDEEEQYEEYDNE